MSRRKRSDEFTSGQDSFLDIVANLVGILIILVVILGARSHQIIQEVTKDKPSEAEIALIEKQAESAIYVDSSVKKLEHSIAAYDAELEIRKQERLALMQLTEVARDQWQQSLDVMGKAKQAVAQLQRQRNQAAEELDKLSAQAAGLDEESENIVAIEHLPTPMAKTVFGDEVHFRLKNGYLSVVPVDQLVNEIKEDLPRLASMARNHERTATVGPIRDYVARYSVEMTRRSVSSGGRMGVASQVRVGELIIEPLREPAGEPVAQALLPQSQFAYELAGRDPASTTITIWVYPNSFAEFRQIKEHLFGLGFPTAARPLPEGHPIAGSPSGSRSQAQ